MTATDSDRVIDSIIDQAVARDDAEPVTRSVADYKARLMAAVRGEGRA